MRHTILAGTTALVLLMGSGVNSAQAALSQNQINEIESTCVAKHGTGWFRYGDTVQEIKNTINTRLKLEYLKSINYKKEDRYWWDNLYGYSTYEQRQTVLINAFNDCKTFSEEDWYHIEQMEEFKILSDTQKMDFYDWLTHAFQDLGSNKARFDLWNEKIASPSIELLHTYTPYGLAFDVANSTAQMVQKVTDEGVVKIAVFYDGALLLIENLIIKKAKPAIDKMEAKAEAVIKKFKLDQLSPDRILSKYFCLGFECASYADLKKIKKDFKIKSNLGTIAVARTNIPGLEGEIIYGLSPKRREDAGLSKKTQSKKDYLKEFNQINIRTEEGHMIGDGPHAEGWILSRIAKHIKNNSIGLIKLTGKKISILVANNDGVCGKCLAKLPPIPKLTGSTARYTGIFKKFTNKYPQVIIKVEAVKSNINLLQNDSPRIRPFEYRGIKKGNIYKGGLKDNKHFFVTGYRGWGFYKRSDKKTKKK